MSAFLTFLYRAALAVVLALCFALANGAFAQTPAEFRIERAGDPDGRTVIFIPGLSSSGEVWSQSAAALDDFDVHAVTLAGFAGLPPVESQAFLPAMRDALIDYVEQEGLGSVAIAGHSLGGQLALQIAAERPDLVDRVLVVDSAPFFLGLFNPAATAEQAAAYAPVAAAQMANAPREAFLAQSRQGMAVQAISEAAQDQVFSWMEASDQATVAQAMGELMGGDFRPLLPQVEAPVTVLIGWEAMMPLDADTLRTRYESQYQGLQQFELRVVQDARHFIMLDQPQAFAVELARWIGEETQ